MQADGSIIIDTKISSDGLEEGFLRIRKGTDSVAASVHKAGQEIDRTFSKMDASKAVKNAEAQLKNLENQFSAISADFSEALAFDDDKSAERLAAKRTAIYDRMEVARERLAAEVAAAAEKEAAAEEKASQRTIKAAEKEAAAKKRAEERQMKELTKPVRHFNSRLREIATGALVFNVISAGLRKVTNYFGEALMANNEFAAATARLRGSLMTAFQPILETITPALITMINWLNVAVQAVARFFAVLSGKSYSEMKKNAQALNQQAGAIESVGQEAKEAAKYLAGFDEINQMIGKEDYSSNLGDTSVDAPTFEEIEIPSEWEAAIDNLAMRIKDIFFTWEDLTPEIIAEKLITALTTIAGGLIGFALGGFKGALIGMTVGAGLGVLLSTIIFDVSALGIIGGGLIGFAIGGPAGALIGITIGAGISIILSKMAFNSDGSITTEELVNTLIGALAVIGGAAIGFALGGPGGAAIGAVIGLGLSFTILGTSFEEIQGKFDELKEKIRSWAGESSKETESGFISPVLEKFRNWKNKISEFFGLTKDDITESMSSAADNTEGVYIEPTEKKFRDLNDEISIDTKHTADGTVSTWEKAYRDTETSYVKPTEEQFDGLSKDISNKFKSTKESIMETFRSLPQWFSQHVTDPIVNFFNKLTDGVVDAFRRTAANVNEAIEDLISGFNRIAGLISGRISDLISSGSSSKSASTTMNTYRGYASAYSAYSVTPEIPHLARGAVIPPNQEFMAVLGDQPSGVNVEAPLSTIQEALRNEMSDLIPAVIAGYEGVMDRQDRILEAVLGIDLDGESISKAVNAYNQKMAVVRGG